MSTKNKWWKGWAVGISLLCASPAGADPLRIQCTAPLQNNSGSCVTPSLSSAGARDSIWVIFKITGSSIARRDSVWRRPGGTIDLSYNLPRGTYTIEAFALRTSVGGTRYYGCPAQISSPTQAPDPWRPTFSSPESRIGP